MFTETWYIDIILVDKQHDLNIYKEKGQQGEASCCAPAAPELDTPTTSKAEARSCCAPSFCISSTPEIKTASLSCKPNLNINEGADTEMPYDCCDKSKAAAEREAMKNVTNIDFNEWVGMYHTFTLLFLQPANKA